MIINQKKVIKTKEDKPILYCMDTISVWGLLLTHRLVNHVNSYTVLMVDKGIIEERNMTDIIMGTQDKIFDEVWLVSTLCSPNLSLGESDYETYIRGFYEEQFLITGYKPGDFERIYVFVDTWCARINAYFGIIKQPYWQIQAFVDQEEPRVYCHHDFKASSEFLKLMNLYRAWSFSADMAHPVYFFDTKDELKRSIDKPYEEWRGFGEMCSVSTDDIDLIAELYGVIPEDLPEVLYLPNSYGLSRNEMNLNARQRIFYSERRYSTEEVFATVLMTALDYYTYPEDLITIKPHPNDPLSKKSCERIYGEEVRVLPPIPMEFFVEYLKRHERKLQNVIGVFSSSIENTDGSMLNKKTVLQRS